MGAKRMIALALGAVLGACAGPRPEVRVRELEPPALPGQPYKVHLLLLNNGGGQGEVDVEVKLLDTRTGETYKDSERVELEEDERVAMIVKIDAPVSDYYRVSAEARYPVE